MMGLGRRRVPVVRHAVARVKPHRKNVAAQIADGGPVAAPLGRGLINGLTEVRLRRHTHKPVDFLPVLEQDKRRYAAHIVLLGQVHLVVNIDFADGDIVPVIRSQLVEYGGQLLAGSAPVGVEVHKHRFVRIEHHLLEATIVDVFHATRARLVFRIALVFRTLPNGLRCVE